MTQKKRKVGKRIGTALLVLVALVVVAAAVLLWISRDYLVWKNSPRPEVTRVPMCCVDMTGYGLDAFYIVRMVERTHPIFIVARHLPEDYVAVRDEFLSIAENTTCRQEFIFAAYRYVMTLQDGHMTGFNLFGRGGMTSGHLMVDWEVYDGRLMLNNENGRTDVEVMEIGGVAPTRIFSIVDEYVFAENQVYRLWNHARYARYGTMIEMAGGEVLGDKVVLTLQEEGERSTMEVKLEVLEAPTEPFSMSAIAASYEFIVRHEVLDDDIFFIDLRIFYLDESIEKTAGYIEQAIADGYRKFIVDLRSNGGGNSMAGERLLQAMGITVPSSGFVRRFSPLMIELAREHNFISPLESVVLTIIFFIADGMIGRPAVDTAYNPNNVFVSVLTDNNTYSSATMMAYWVQDGDFGNIIGMPSRNAPSAFGDMLTFTLPYSGLEVRVSHAQFLRPDTNADQSTLWPDIMVESDDALDVALEYLRNRGN